MVRNRLNTRTILRRVLVALVSTTAIYGLISLHAQYRDVIADTYAQAETITELLEEHAQSTVDSVDQLVQRAQERLAPEGLRSYTETDWHELRRLSSSLPAVEALAVFDRDGRMVLTSRIYPAPEYSAADREYFQDHRDRGVALVLGKAVEGRTALSKAFFTISRSVIGGDGSFQGIIVAVIDVGYFRHIYQRLNLGEHAAVALLRTDGALLLREPFSAALLKDGMAERVRAWKLFSDYIDRGIPAGSYEGSSTADGLMRTFAFRKLERLPLVVLVMLSHQDALARTLPGILRSAGLGATVVGFLLVLTWWSFRIIDREDRAQRDLADSNRRLSTALDGAEAASRAKSIFLSNMSHELRTPLNAILGFAEALRDGYAGPTTPRQVEYLDHIHEGGRHLLDILCEVLDLSKVASGTLVLNEDIVDVRAILDAVQRIMLDKAQARSIALHTDVAENLPALRADSLRCKQVLLSLVSNAVKFTPPGGVVTVTARSDRGLILEVQDNGPGISPGDIADALDAFGALASSPTKTHGGVGIGLPLARKLAELHGGTLTIDSAIGKGTRVTVTFPDQRIVRNRVVERQGA